MRGCSFKVFLAVFLIITFSFSAFSYSIKEVEDNITKAIVNYLIQKEPSFSGSTIEVEYKYASKVFDGLSKKKEKIKYEVAELYPGFKPLGNIIVPIQVILDEVPKEKIFLRSRISVIKDVVAAKKSIKKGEIFGEDNIGVMPRDISGSYDKNYFTSTQEVYDKEAKTYIPKSYIVVSWMVKEKSLVTKRAKVRIKAIVGDVEVSADGEILEDGARGAKVKVKNLASNKVVIGTVVSSGEVLVETL